MFFVIHLWWNFVMVKLRNFLARKNVFTRKSLVLKYLNVSMASNEFLVCKYLSSVFSHLFLLPLFIIIFISFILFDIIVVSKVVHHLGCYRFLVYGCIFNDNVLRLAELCNFEIAWIINYKITKGAIKKSIQKFTLSFFKHDYTIANRKRRCEKILSN